jgi:hypothetical protein
MIYTPVDKSLDFPFIKTPARLRPYMDGAGINNVHEIYYGVERKVAESEMSVWVPINDILWDILNEA